MRDRIEGSIKKKKQKSNVPSLQELALRKAVEPEGRARDKFIKKLNKKLQAMAAERTMEARMDPLMMR